ncbi:hypothetical protein V2I01_19915 [Micromonospora sp. BRA006-A]|nr:hypothetical protein [Micromonospora sp. BRA006-A]
MCWLAAAAEMRSRRAISPVVQPSSAAWSTRERVRPSRAASASPCGDAAAPDAGVRPASRSTG